MAIKIRHKHSNRLVTANLLLKEGTTTHLYVRNAADSAYKSMLLDEVWAASRVYLSNGAKIASQDTDDTYATLEARDNGVGLVEVARLAGGATPTLQLKAGKLTGALDCNSQVLKDLKNSAASALSGTQKDIEIDIGGTPYYFTVYPTKA